jgi:hypothetical protein
VQLGLSLIPVSGKLGVRAESTPDGVRITWRPQNAKEGKVFYRVLRGKPHDVGCGGRLNNASDDCRLYANDVGGTHGTEFVDHPGSGSWTYHIGVATNWLDDPTLGEVYVLSRPVTVTVP